MLSQEKQWLLTEKYGGEKSPAFFTDCERLAAGEPLAYVIGFVPFLGCRIYLDSKPLIPRSETEFWVEKAIAHIGRTYVTREATHPLQVLDLCAGSGCIGIAVAKAFPDTHITFAEVDPAHLPVIKKNLQSTTPIDWSSGLHDVVASDLFEHLNKKYDLILTNPPYIDPVLDRAESSVKDYEPHLALYGGRNGLELIERILTEAPAYLLPKGQLWIEHEPEQSEAIQMIAASKGFSASTHNDQYGIARYTVLTCDN